MNMQSTTMTNLIKCFDEKVIDEFMKNTNYNFDCVNIILEFAGYKYRNGKYMKQIYCDDFKIVKLNSMPKICRIPSNNNNKPHFRVVIHKQRLNIPYVHIISTYIYFNTVHWHLDLGIINYDSDGKERIKTIFDIHKYIYREHTKENKPCKSIFFNKKLCV